MTLPRPTAVIFDWDNTLINNWPSIAQSMNAVMRAFGRPEWTIEQTMDNAKRSTRELFPEMFGDEWQKARQIFWDHFGSIHLDHMDVLVGTVELLEALQAANIPLYIVSNKMKHFLTKEVASLGWDKYFTTIVGAGEAEKDKPHIAPVIMALGKLPENEVVWFIGDATVDVTCARAANCLPLLVNANNNTVTEANLPPTQVFSDIPAILELFKKLA